MAQQDLEWFMNDEAAFASLTTEQVNTLSGGGTVEYGETDEPAKADDEEISETPAAEVEEEKPEEVKPEPVVQARDGVHTIPFSELEDARSRAQYWEQVAREKQEATTPEPVQSDEQQLSVRELRKLSMEAMMEGDIEKAADLQEQADAVVTKIAEANAERLMQPLRQSAQDQAVDAHFSTIKAAIPDFDDLVQANAVQDWIKTQPSFMQGAANQVLQSGTTQEVIELFAAYKAAHPQDAAPSKENIKAAADKAIANARTRTPVTLNDIPAAGTTSSDEDPTTAAGWQQKFAKMAPADIMRELERR